MKIGPVYRTLSVLLTALAFHGNADAADTLLTRETAIVTALRENRELRVAAFEIDAARARLHWAGLLPNPELEITASDDFLGEGEGERSLEVGFTQRFPVTSALRNSRELRRHQLEIARLEFASRQRQLAHETDKAWIELAIAAHTTALHKDLLALNDEIVTFLEDRAAVGEASRLDVAQAQLKSRLLGLQIAGGKAQEQSASLRLLQLAGLPGGTPPNTGPSPELPTAPPATSLNTTLILSKRDDYQVLLLQSPAAETRLALAKARSWEEISLSIFYEAERSIDEPEGAATNHFGGLGLSIPLPFRKHNGADIAEAEITITRADAAREALAFAIQSQAEAALETRATAHRLATEARGDLLADAHKLLKETTAAYRSGLASFLQVQQAQEQLLELNTGAARLLKDYLMADAGVRFATADYPVDLPQKESPAHPANR